MAAAGASAVRCLTILHLVVIILGHPWQALGLQGAGTAAVIPPSYEELTTSLAVNQLAILQLMRDASNPSSAAPETCTQSEARREEEAAARDARLKEALLQALEAGRQRSSQETLEALRATQETLTASCRAEVDAVRQEVTALREEVGQQKDSFLEELHKLAAPACPLGWVRRENSCYLFDATAKRTWEESRAHCRGLGGDLVKISSAEENQFIKGQIGDSVWIGLNDRATEGHFLWSDGSQPTYTAWSTHYNIIQPDDAGLSEDCTELRKDYNYAWNDWQCHFQIASVCEKTVGA